MKAIKEVAKEQILKIKLNEANVGHILHGESKRINGSLFSDLLSFAEVLLTEAQRWIPVEEELPEERSVVLGKIANLNYPHLFCYDEINSEWYHLDGFEFIGSDLIPTHWRPIERK